MTAHASCRACGASGLLSVLDLGLQPLANAFVSELDLDDPEDRYPLHLVRCAQCGLCQLDTVIDPRKLYGRHYAYRSGYAQGWRDHCRALAKELAGKTVLDIGCLDGVLLDECAKEGCTVFGCDPSGASDHPLIPELFTKDTRAGQFDVIVAQNVLGHVDDARGFLEGIKANLKPTGYAVIEAPWVVDLIEHRRWDTIYHEHLSYWTAYPLAVAAKAAWLDSTAVRRFPDLHGGTLRYHLTHPQFAEPVVLGDPKNGPNAQSFERFRDSVHCEIQWWADWFQEHSQRVIAGYGASAKSSTFLNALPKRPPLVGIFDDNPHKQNLYTPGHHFPVLKPTKMTMRDCEILINFAPNWDLEKKARSLGFTGEVKSIWRA